MTTRSQIDIWADLGATYTGSPDPERLSALWYEMGRTTADDRSVPGWAQMAAMTLGDRYAADAREAERLTARRDLSAQEQPAP